MLEARHGAVVDGVLKLVYLLYGLHVAVLPVLEVEEFKVCDTAFAVPEQLKHILGGELGKVQYHTGAGMELTQLL